ncbi:MAG: nucleotidyltransferase family protein [bacterium]
MTLSKEKILKTLSAKKPYLKEKYGFNEIMLFGSFAKNSENENSDIDIAVKLSSQFKTLSNYINAKDELSELLDKRPIDLVYYNPEFLNPIILMEIETEKIIIE